MQTLLRFPRGWRRGLHVPPLFCQVQQPGEGLKSHRHLMLKQKGNEKHLKVCSNNGCNFVRHQPFQAFPYFETNPHSTLCFAFGHPRCERHPNVTAHSRSGNAPFAGARFWAGAKKQRDPPPWKKSGGGLLIKGSTHFLSELVQKSSQTVCTKMVQIQKASKVLRNSSSASTNYIGPPVERFK